MLKIYKEGFKIITSELKTNALVKQGELSCYNWVHEESLCIVAKLDNIDEERGVYLFQAYNIDRDEWGGVTSDQVIILDETILTMPPLMEGCDVITGHGGFVRGIKYIEDQDDEE